jgi:LPS-assembly protein
VLKTDRVQLDFEANEGIAEGAVLRFMDVPILALPTLSFPLGDGRKSGWLPPTLDFDTRSGLSVAVPYYWNIAPNRDATFTPKVITRRGAGAGAASSATSSPATAAASGRRAAQRPRGRPLALGGVGEHDGTLPLDGRWHADGLRVSDDAWWKDFPKDSRSLNARLLPLRLEAERDSGGRLGPRPGLCPLLRWQVLQGSDVPVVSPYERAPQLGVQARWRLLAGGLQYSVQTEANRFVLPDRDGSAAEPTGWRAHALGSLSRPWRQPGAWVVPRLSVNLASYALDQAHGRRPHPRVARHPQLQRRGRAGIRARHHAVRPLAAPDAGAARAVRQHPVPRPDRAAELRFGGQGLQFQLDLLGQRVLGRRPRVRRAPGHRRRDHASAGRATGAEALRLGVVQRYLLRTQQITPEGVPFSQRFSDLFLLGLANLGAAWRSKARCSTAPTPSGRCAPLPRHAGTRATSAPSAPPTGSPAADRTGRTGLAMADLEVGAGRQQRPRGGRPRHAAAAAAAPGTRWAA